MKGHLLKKENVQSLKRVLFEKFPKNRSTYYQQKEFK